MQLSVPAIIQATGGGGGTGAPNNYLNYIDLAYQSFNARLIQFAIANAFSDGVNTSQAERGLADVPGRHTQNNARNTAFALGLATGNGALNIHSITREFVNDIVSLNYARLRFAIFSQTVADKSAGLNFSTGKISSITASLNASAVTSGIRGKGFIANNGGNYFLIIATDNNTIKSIPCDANGNIIAGTINTVTANFSSSTRAELLAVKNQYVWVVGQYNNNLNGQLYQVSSTGVFSTVGAVANISADSSQSVLTHFTADSYTVGNTCYCVAMAWNTGNSGYWMDTSYTINLATVTVFTATAWKSNPGIAQLHNQYGGKIEVGYNGTSILIHIGTKIYTLTATTLTEVATVTRSPWICRFRNSIDKLAINVNNFATNDNLTGFKFNGINLLTYNTSLAGTVALIYYLDGTLAEDDAGAFKTLICPDAFSNMADGLSMQLNGDTIGYDLIGNMGGLFITSPILLDVGTKGLDFSLAFANTNSRQVKMGFQITGGNYNSPTGTNDASGNATSGRTPSTNASYIDLMLS